MSFFDRLQSGIKKLGTDIGREITKFNHRDFYECSMAACALIALADGKITAEEQKKTAEWFTHHEILKAFDVEILRNRFNFWCAKIKENPEFGRIEALQTIGKLRAKRDEANALIQVCLIIAKADGQFDEVEQAVIKDICQTLDIDPKSLSI